MVNTVTEGEVRILLAGNIKLVRVGEMGWVAIGRPEQELDEKYGLGVVRGAIQELMDAGLLAPQPLEPLAHLVLSVEREAARYIARADDMPTARKEMGASMERLFDGMRVKG